MTARCASILVAGCGLPIDHLDAGFELFSARLDPCQAGIQLTDEGAAFPTVDRDQNVALFGRIALDDIDRRDPAGHPAADGDHVCGDAGVVDEDMGKLLVQPPAAADQDD